MQIIKKIFYILFALTLFSCNVTKNIQKKKTEEKVETETQTTTTRTVTEMGVKTVEIPADTLDRELDLQPLLNGEKVTGEDDNVTFTVSIIPGTKKEKITIVQKPRKEIISVNKTTIENVDEHKKSKSDIIIKEKDKHIEKTTGFNWNYLWWLLVLLFIPIYRYRKFLFGSS